MGVAGAGIGIMGGAIIVQCAGGPAAATSVRIGSALVSGLSYVACVDQTIKVK